MTPNFIEELFLRIEERLNDLELEMHEMRAELSSLCEFRSELESIKRWTRFGRGVLLAVWGFIVTAVNLIISRWINGD